MNLPDIPPVGAGLRLAFRSEAGAATIALPGGASVDAKPYEEHDGSLGWAGRRSVLVLVGGQWVPATATVKLSLTKSAAWPQE